MPSLCLGCCLVCFVANMLAHYPLFLDDHSSWIGFCLCGNLIEVYGMGGLGVLCESCLIVGAGLDKLVCAEKDEEEPSCIESPAGQRLAGGSQTLRPQRTPRTERTTRTGPIVSKAQPLMLTVGGGDSCREMCCGFGAAAAIASGMPALDR